MYRLVCILLLFLLEYSSANGPYRNRYRKPYRPYSGKGKGSYRKSSGTAVANYPRCMKSSTWLSIVVLDKDGTPMANTIVFAGQPEIVSQVEKNNEGYVKTDKKGHVKVKVRGCDVGIVVWTNDENAKYRYVNLDKCTKDYWKVVIQIGKACNFLVYVDGSEDAPGALTPVIKFQKQELVYYLVDSDGGEESTSGSAVVGPNASPICVNVKNEGSLKITMISQTSDLSSVMCMDRVEEGGQAAMALPIPASYIYGTLVIDEEFIWSLAVGSNVFVDQESKVIPFFCGMPDARGLCDRNTMPIFNMGIHVLWYDTVKNMIARIEENQFWSWAAARGPLSRSKKYVVAVNLAVENMDENKRSNLEGNVYITDRKGFTRTIKIPSETYPITNDHPPVPYYWILGCVREGGLKKFREINKFNELLPSTAEELEKLCNDGTLPQQQNNT